jgi:hypothetical protein
MVRFGYILLHFTVVMTENCMEDAGGERERIVCVARMG